MNIEEKTKLAHEYFLRFSNTTVKDAWYYADEMEKQANDRIKQKAIEDAKESREIMDSLNLSNSTPLKPEVDWSQAPKDATHYVIFDDGLAYWHKAGKLECFDIAPSFSLVGLHVVKRPK
jgi:hypothetical protein